MNAASLRTGWLQRREWRPGQEESTAVGGGLLQVEYEGDKSEGQCHRPSAKVMRARIDVTDRARGSVVQAACEGDEREDRSTS
jgi:hypothetical protein